MEMINEINIKRIHIEEKIKGHFFIYFPKESMIYHTYLIIGN